MVFNIRKGLFHWFLCCFYSLRHDVGVGACGSEPPETVTDYQLRGRTGAPAAQGTWNWCSASIPNHLVSKFNEDNEPEGNLHCKKHQIFRFHSWSGVDFVRGEGRRAEEQAHMTWLWQEILQISDTEMSLNLEDLAQQAPWRTTAHGPWEVHPKLIP